MSRPDNHLNCDPRPIKGVDDLTPEYANRHFATRRQFLITAAWASTFALARPRLESDASPASPEDLQPIVDSHQHLWDLDRQLLPWLDSAPALLKRSFTPGDYEEATRGLNVVRAVYMEVDVEAKQHVAETESVVSLCRRGTTPTRAAVIGERPASPDFAERIKILRAIPQIKGVRQVLHSSETPHGFCLRPEFVKGVRALGESGLRFDLCLRPGELPDGIKLSELCPETRFVVDHCGNADPKAFRRGSPVNDRSHDPDAWRRAMDGLSRRPNVLCKISGIVASAPKEWTSADLAPVVNHCLDAFGPDRVMFGGDWPVCLLGSTYRGWVEALREIVASRPLTERRKIWHDNAVAFYALT